MLWSGSRHGCCITTRQIEAPMHYLVDPQTFWLNITNLALGLATVAVLILLARNVFADIAGK
jgi:hypothetical protein